MSTEILSQALQYIQHHQDGEVAEALNYKGLVYNMNYGVSITLLTKFAKQHGTNQEVANLLWKEDFREAKLLAFMMSEIDTISDNIVDTFVIGIKNHEMAEIGAMYLFSKITFSDKRLLDWISSNNEYIKMTGYLCIYHLAKKNHITVFNIKTYLQHFNTDFTSSSYFVRKALINSFQELAFRKPGLKKPIIEATKKLIIDNKNQEFELQAKDMLHVLNYC